MNTEKVQIWAIAILFVLIAFNASEIRGLRETQVLLAGYAPLGAVAPAPSSFPVLSNPPEIIPSGVPEYYGKELGVSFDDVNAQNPVLADSTIEKLAGLDRTLTLSSPQLTRYINILYQVNNGISCEYCCGARSVIFENGAPACGCAHSYAMRGITKYLIINYGSAYSDEQIQEEVAKWKTLFFPTQIQQKATILQSQNITPTYSNVGSNLYRGIERGAGLGGMVGGC